jgi:hypothetical protein
MNDEIKPKVRRQPMPLRRVITYIMGITTILCIGLYAWLREGELLTLAVFNSGVFAKMLTTDTDVKDVQEMNGPP